MRFRFVVSLTAVALVVCSCSKTTEDKLIGEWKGTDSGGKTASFVFNRDRSVRMLMGNLVVDGPTLGGKVEWRVDATHEPMSLDIVATAPSGQQSVLPMIIRFITDQKLQVRTSPDMQSRPVGFSPEVIVAPSLHNVGGRMRAGCCHAGFTNATGVRLCCELSVAVLHR
jgi:hypothetical protein